MTKADTSTHEAQDSDFRPCDFVYAGLRPLTNGGKPGALVYRLTEGTLQPGSFYDPKLLKGKGIGCIYRGAVFTDTLVRGLGHATYVGRWEGMKELIDWRARDEAMQASIRSKKLETDAKKTVEIEAMMLPLREMYAAYSRQYDHVGKEALELAVLRALRSAPRKSELVPKG